MVRRGEAFENAKIYHPEDELAPMYKMKYFLDNVWYSQGKTLPSIGNTEEEKAMIKQFIADMSVKEVFGTIAFPPAGEAITQQLAMLRSNKTFSNQH